MVKKLKTAFITGSEGFIGGYLSKVLLNKYQVVGGYYKMNKFKKLKGVKYVFCDVRNLDNIKKIFKKYKPSLVFHLAAKSHPFYSFTNPIETMNTNVIGTINLLETCKKDKLKPKIIIACSSGQYGSRPFSKLPMVEKNEYDPEHIYGLSKVFQDSLSKQYYKMFKLKIIRAILFNTSGPGKKFDVFFDICRQFSHQINKKKIIIKCGNLNNFRDFMHVEDVARGLLFLSQKGIPGESYNIGSAKLIKISKIIDLLRKKYKKNIIIKTEKNLLRKFDEKFITASVNKIKKLGWQPSKNINDIINDMINSLSN
tara:strand:- start:2728 stop:3663 length:936 start_codon:yes stop_codon:yes gene_type:complete